MGAWDSGIFDNDEALDWVQEFLNLPTAQAKEELIERTLEAALRSEHMDCGVVESAMAAGETIAAVLGRPSAQAPAELQDWARKAEADFSALLPRAVKIAQTLRGSAAYRSMWLDSTSYPRWQSHADDLIARLKAERREPHSQL